jgi:hypothetical protein
VDGAEFAVLERFSGLDGFLAAALTGIVSSSYFPSVLEFVLGIRWLMYA